jgi:hypothetical protein
MSTRLTRRQLYELVWDEPMTKLAAQFGLSDVGLRKICHKHRVPTPPAGFWAKKAYGKRVTIKPLPSVANEAEILIRESAASNEPAPIAEARIALAAAASASSPETPSPNPIVERTLTKLANTRRGADGLLRSTGANFARVTVRPESVERAGEILRQFVSAGTTSGLRLTKHEGGAAWLCNGEIVEFELVEVTDQVPHTATEAELRAVAKWKREREETHRKYGYWRDWGEPRIPKWDHRFQGRLAIKLEKIRIQSERSPWGDAIISSFVDSRTRTVTKVIPRIVGTIGAIAAAKRVNREFEVRRRAAAEKAAREYEEMQRRRAHEQKAISLLDKLMVEQESEARLRFLAGALRAKNVSGRRAVEFLKWLDQKLLETAAANSPAALEDRLADAGLFEPGAR